MIVARSDRAGYQICRFCWHHIKENLNKRCPACRRVYTDEGVEFKPLAASECVPIPSPDVLCADEYFPLLFLIAPRALATSG